MEKNFNEMSMKELEKMHGLIVTEIADRNKQKRKKMQKIKFMNY